MPTQRTGVRGSPVRTHSRASSIANASRSTTGTPLGLLPGLSYSQAMHMLAAGDLLVLFSDGVTEAQNEGSEEFGEVRLLEVLRALRTAPLDELIGCVFEAIDRFADGAPQFDDITMLAIRRVDWSSTSLDAGNHPVAEAVS